MRILSKRHLLQSCLTSWAIFMYIFAQNHRHRIFKMFGLYNIFPQQNLPQFSKAKEDKDKP